MVGGMTDLTNVHPRFGGLKMTAQLGWMIVEHTWMVMMMVDRVLDGLS